MYICYPSVICFPFFFPAFSTTRVLLWVCLLPKRNSAWLDARAFEYIKHPNGKKAKRDDNKIIGNSVQYIFFTVANPIKFKQLSAKNYVHVFVDRFDLKYLSSDEKERKRNVWKSLALVLLQMVEMKYSIRFAF